MDNWKQGLQTARESTAHAGRYTRLAEWVAAMVERHPYVSALLSLVGYVALIWKAVERPLWYDELYTFYIAQQATWARMLEAIRAVDLNPVLNYALTRWSIAVFGTSPWAVRLPALVAFWIAGAAVFVLLRRKTTAVHGAIGTILLWCSPFFLYAAEARPYALVLAFSALLLLGWGYATSDRRVSGLVLLLLAGFGLMLSHILGSLPLGAVWVAEGVRSWKRRNMDVTVILVLLLPLSAVATYGPMLHAYGGASFAPEAQASLGKAWYLYMAVFRWMWRPLLVIALVAWGWKCHTRQADGDPYPVFGSGMAVGLALLFLVPVGVNLLFMRSHGAFYDRYGIASALAIAVGAPAMLAKWTRGDRSCGSKALVLVILCVALQGFAGALTRTISTIMPEKISLKLVNVVAPVGSSPFRPWWKRETLPTALQEQKRRAPAVSSLSAVRPDVPIVAASELTFVEMDSREPAAVRDRLYYLMDRQAALQITHRSFADEMLTAKQYFPIRGRVARYQDFVRSHPTFLVLGTYEYPGDWLLKKLAMDGAGLRVIAKYAGYKDSDVYEVTVHLSGK